MQVEHNSVLQHILAKLLMLETMQMGILTLLAGQSSRPGELLDKLISDAESDLRVLAIAAIERPLSSGPTADLALRYLAENAQTLKSILAKE